MELSERLNAVIGLVTPGNRAADIGCDHGFTAIELVRRGVCPSVIASDLRPGPLSRAREHVEAAGLRQQIELRLGDGLRVLEPGDADTLIAAGIGGRLLIRMLKESERTAKSAEELILSPQSDLRAVRTFLRDSGYTLQRERYLREDGKDYFIFRVLPGTDRSGWTDGQLGFGGRVDPGDREAWRGYLQREKALREKILGELTQNRPGQEARAKDLREEIRQIDGLLSDGAGGAAIGGII